MSIEEELRQELIDEWAREEDEWFMSIGKFSRKPRVCGGIYRLLEDNRECASCEYKETDPYKTIAGWHYVTWEDEKVPNRNFNPYSRLKETLLEAFDEIDNELEHENLPPVDYSAIVQQIDSIRQNINYRAEQSDKRVSEIASSLALIKMSMDAAKRSREQIQTLSAWLRLMIAVKAEDNPDAFAYMIDEVSRVHGTDIEMHYDLLMSRLKVLIDVFGAADIAYVRQVAVDEYNGSLLKGETVAQAARIAMRDNSLASLWESVVNARRMLMDTGYKLSEHEYNRESNNARQDQGN